MACDYEAIRRHNERCYGTDIGRIGPMLLADRYDDRTHFIFELLQNAEDALAHRTSWSGQRSVRFHLTDHELRVSHSGKPFDEADVRGICGIAESTKGLTAIGLFGIGFKSVYAFTDRPTIHSGAEDFAIESFVWPAAAPPVARDHDETIIVIPLKADGAADREEITAGLQRIGAGALLFLRQIDEIEWRVENGPSGLYLRSQAEGPVNPVRRITVIGQEEGKPGIEENWLVFSRPVARTDGSPAGHVELAFSIVRDEKSKLEGVIPVSKSPLVVFFPTVVETHLGFLVQGPYRTTPSRDNVPRHDEWNQHCVQETAGLLVDALRWLRDHALLDTGTLRSLPIDLAKFGEGAMFAPLFDATKQALATEPLLPRFGGGHVAARGARLARTQELRELFDPTQLRALFGDDEELAWLSGDISQDRAPELRQYLMRELKIAEITPEAILSQLDTGFLEAQADEWVLRLYEFLNGQTALRQKAAALPLIRLADGTHVNARENGQPRAFLPGVIETGFPTVRKSVSSTEAALAFLRALGLDEPDAVDDVVQNVLPKYGAPKVAIDDVEYDADMRRMVTAFATDSKGQREKLLAALRQTPFVMAVHAGNAIKQPSKPGELYLATDRLRNLFAGVPDVLLVDDRYSCLRGEDVREMLEACGTVRYVRPIEDASLSWEERKELRTQAGHAETSGQNDRITDWMLLGLKDLIESLARLDVEERRKKAMLLWEELAHLEERRGKSVFTGEYTWTHYGSYRTAFDAAFVRMLNTMEWIPDSDGKLQLPQLVLFDSLGWKQNPFLQSKLRFRPPIIDQLAREAGIEPGVLDLLRKHGVTSVAELVARLGLEEEPKKEDEAAGDTPPPVPLVRDPTGTEPLPSDSGDGTGRGAGAESGGGRTKGAGTRGDKQDRGGTKEPGQVGTRRTPGSPGGRPFVSYVGTHPDEEGQDPDGLDQPARMALEARAIDLILAREPNWHRTPNFNPGYDLFEAGPDAQPNRWCEVKAMTGSLGDRPVGLSRTQFECARQHGDAYWLYVVERTGTESARLVRIQDPVGKARTFTFDHGWFDVAEADGEQEDRED
ncbi:MAG: DUF3883 domain-containing protein [Candidatus Aenigmarchaeota archaeon]|nr:DUF3883 domain-containing protein [Candidatus Aenigmarchaeota archaeon]